MADYEGTHPSVAGVKDAAITKTSKISIELAWLIGAALIWIAFQVGGYVVQREYDKRWKEEQEKFRTDMKEEMKTMNKNFVAFQKEIVRLGGKKIKIKKTKSEEEDEHDD